MTVSERFWGWVARHTRAETKQAEPNYKDGLWGGVPQPSNTVNELEFSWRHAYFASCLNVIGSSAMGVPLKVMRLQQLKPELQKRGSFIPAAGPQQLRHAVSMRAQMQPEPYRQWLAVRGLEAEEADDSHPLRQLFDKPNQFLDTWPEFIMKTMVHLVGTGDAYWELVGGEGGAAPTELYTMQPDRVTILGDKQKWVGGYKYKVGFKEINYAADEVLHFRLPHPMNDLYGLSRADTLDPQLKLSWNAYKLNGKFFENGARPGGILTPKGEKSLDNVSVDRVREQFNARHVGINNMGKVAILPIDMQFIPDTTAPKDLEFEALLNHVEHEISGVLGVPRALTGRTADVNRSNLDATKVIFWTQTMVPLFSLLLARLNASVAPRYGDGCFVEADYSGIEILQEEQSTASARAVAEFNASVITRNEAREAIGEDALEGPDGDVFKNTGTEKFKALGDDPTVVELPPTLQGVGSSPPDSSGQKEKAVLGDSAAAMKRALNEVLQARPELDEDELKAIAKRYLRFEDDTRPFELSLEASIRSLVSRLRQQTIDELKKLRPGGVVIVRGFDDAIFQIFVPQNIADILWEIVAQMIQVSAMQGAKNINKIPKIVKDLEPVPAGTKTPGLGLTFDTMNPFTQAHMRQKELLIKTIPYNWHERVRDAILEGNAKGEGVQAMTRRINKVYDGIGDYEARRIAQTEVIGGYNNGAFAGAVEAGTDGKMWIATLDNLVRDSHSELHGEIRPIQKPFSNGLMYPGQAGGPAEEVINCRCTFAPVELADYGMVPDVIDDVTSIPRQEVAYSPATDLSSANGIQWQQIMSRDDTLEWMDGSKWRYPVYLPMVGDDIPADALFFTDSSASAKAFIGAGGKTRAAYIRVENPWKVTEEEWNAACKKLDIDPAKARVPLSYENAKMMNFLDGAYDGIIIEFDKKVRQFIVFEKKQVVFVQRAGETVPKAVRLGDEAAAAAAAKVVDATPPVTLTSKYETVGPAKLTGTVEENLKEIEQVSLLARDDLSKLKGDFTRGIQDFCEGVAVRTPESATELAEQLYKRLVLKGTAKTDEVAQAQIKRVLYDFCIMSDETVIDLMRKRTYKFEGLTTRFRSYYVDDKMTVVFAQDIADHELLHEWLHAVEGAYIEKYERHLGQAWLSTTHPDGVTKPLSQILGNASYADTEVAYVGGWSNAYVGKYYSHGNSEVISMIPHTFLAQKWNDADREHLEFALGFLRGGMTKEFRIPKALDAADEVAAAAKAARAAAEAAEAARIAEAARLAKEAEEAAARAAELEKLKKIREEEAAKKATTELVSPVKLSTKSPEKGIAQLQSIAHDDIQSLLDKGIPVSNELVENCEKLAVTDKAIARKKAEELIGAFNIEGIPDGLLNPDLKNLREALYAISLITDESVFKLLKGMRFKLELSDTKRAKYLTGHRTLVISPSSNVATCFHELMHGVEEALAGKTKGPIGSVFIKTKATNTQTRPLRQITGNMNYRADELALEGDWSLPYIGKVIISEGEIIEKSSEVFSMFADQLDRLATAVVRGKFTAMDQEHIEFVLGILRGGMTSKVAVFAVDETVALKKAEEAAKAARVAKAAGKTKEISYAPINDGKPKQVSLGKPKIGEANEEAHAELDRLRATVATETQAILDLADDDLPKTTRELYSALAIRTLEDAEKLADDIYENLVYMEIPDALQVTIRESLINLCLVSDETILAMIKTGGWSIDVAYGREMVDEYFKVITLSKNSTEDTIIHELLHVVEESIVKKTKRGVSEDFVKLHATEKTKKRLDSLPGGELYDHDELAYLGNWHDPYVGKVYGKGTGEVLSTTANLIEEMTMRIKRSKFTATDRAHLEYSLGILRGNTLKPIAVADDAIVAMKAKEAERIASSEKFKEKVISKAEAIEAKKKQELAEDAALLDISPDKLEAARAAERERIREMYWLLDEIETAQIKAQTAYEIASQKVADLAMEEGNEEVFEKAIKAANKAQKELDKANKAAEAAREPYEVAKAAYYKEIEDLTAKKQKLFEGKDLTAEERIALIKKEVAKNPKPVTVKVGKVGQKKAPIKATDTEADFYKPENFVLISNVKLKGASHTQQIYEHRTEGGKWLFKPQTAEPFRAQVDIAAARVAQELGIKTPAMHVVEVDGVVGSMQKIQDTKGTLKSVAIAKLTPEELEAIQQEQVLDWLMSNHDSHADNFLVLLDGSVIGVDKGQSFRFFGDDKLSTTYAPNKAVGAPEPIYNAIYRAAKNGTITLSRDPVYRTIEKIEKMSDETYIDFLRKYAEGRFGKDTKALEDFYQAALKRKKNIRKDFDAFLDENEVGVARKKKEVVTVEKPKKPRPEGAKPDRPEEELAPVKKQLKLEKLEAELPELGFKGRTIPMGGLVVEDQNLRVWQEKGPDGKLRTVMQLKVRQEFDDKIVEGIRATGDVTEGPYLIVDRNVKKGQLTAIADDGNLPSRLSITDIPTTGKHVPAVQEIRIDQLEFELPNGVIGRYVPHYEGNAWSLQGTMDIIIPSTSADNVAATLLDIEELGIPIKKPTKAEAEYLYLKRQEFAAKEEKVVAYEVLMWRIKDLPLEEKVQRIKEYWVDKLELNGIDELEALPEYNPNGFTEKSFNGKSNAGPRTWRRFDIPEEIFEEGYEMQGTYLHHRITREGEDTASELAKILDNTGTLLSTTERIRLGIGGKTMGQTTDIFSGAAEYLFTSHRSRAVRRSSGLNFKPELMLRTDAIWYEADMYGNTRDANVLALRTGNVRQWLEARPGGEVFFKKGIPLLENLESITVETAEERDSVLKVLRDRGITKLPDGRKIEDIVIIIK